MGNPVTAADVKDGRCEGITVHNPPLSTVYRAESYILATGRFLGGGLWADMERITEPLFHLPVFQPESRGEVVPGAVLPAGGASDPPRGNRHRCRISGRSMRRERSS